jgi:hypothetical protein
MRIGKNLLDQMPNDFRNDNDVLNTAIHMLMRFGDVKRAEHVFGMAKKNVVTYGAMIKGNLL